MSGVEKRVKLSENSPVEFDLDGQLMTGIVVRLEGCKVVVRYRSERIIELLWYEVRMVQTEVGEDLDGGGDGISVKGGLCDDFNLEYDRCEDDGLPSYFGTSVDSCFHCGDDVDEEEILNERCLGNWEVPICMICLTDPDQRSCQECGERHGRICDESEDGLKC